MEPTIDDLKKQIEELKQQKSQAKALDEQIEELNDLLDTIEQNKRQYINPTAFIFGRYVIVNKNIDGKKLNDVFNKYSNNGLFYQTFNKISNILFSMVLVCTMFFQCSYVVCC